MNRFNNSVLLIDKPAGKTSFDTIAEIKKILCLKKIGHSGILDKFASGLLVVCTGFATKLTRFFLESDKAYNGEIKLGIMTDTHDMEGRIIKESPFEGITDGGIKEALSVFVGKSSQVPPEYSSLKIKGRRASDLVREGKEVSLNAREVNIYGIELKKFNAETGRAEIYVRCSKGTYIRALARDLGEALKCGAHLSGLRRVASGNFSVDSAVTADEIKHIISGREASGTNKDFMIKPADALIDFGSVILEEKFCQRVLNGSYFKREDVLDMDEKDCGRYMILDKDRGLIAVADIDIQKWNIKYLNIFNKGASNN